MNRSNSPSGADVAWPACQAPSAPWGVFSSWPLTRHMSGSRVQAARRTADAVQARLGAKSPRDGHNAAHEGSQGIGAIHE